MKKTLSLIIICASLAAASAAPEKRAQWWTVRGDALARERDELAQKKGTGQILPLLDREIARARKMAELGRGAEDHPEQGKGIRETAAEIVPVSFAVWTMRALSDKVPFKNGADISLFREKVRSIYTAKGIEASDPYIDRVIKAAVETEDRSFFAFETGMKALYEKSASIEKKAGESVAETALTRLAASNETNPDLRACVVAAADDYFKRFNFKEALSSTDSAAAESWVGSKILSTARYDAEKLSSAAEFSGSAGSDAAKLSAFFDRKTDIEPYFLKLTTRYMDTSPFPKSSSPSVKIPAEPDMAALFLEIDEARKAALKDRAASADEAVLKAEARMNESVKKYMNPCADAFFRQEERARILAGDETAGQNPAAADPLRDARSVFKEKMRKTSLYRAASIKAVSIILSEHSAPKNRNLLSSYRARIDESRFFITFLCALDEKAARSADFPPSDSKRIYSGLHMQERDLFDYVQTKGVIEKDERQGMTKDEIVSAQKLKESFGKEYHSALSLVAERRTRSALTGAEMKKAERIQDAKCDEAFAQAEIASLCESIDDWTKACSSLDQSRQSFEAYAVLYTKLSREVRSGQTSEDLMTVIRNSSLFPVLGTFDAAAVNAESFQRTYIRKSALKDISRLKTLSDYYTRQKIACGKIPSAAELRAAEQKLGRSPSAPVEQWTMTAANFTEIDKKAAKALTNMRKRSAWSAGETSAEKAADTKAVIEKAGISISLPDGFEEKILGDTDKASFVKRYESLDNLSSISVAVIPLDGKTGREVSEEWLSKMGKKIVRSSVEKRDNDSCYRNLSRDDHHNVTECLSVTKGTDLVIIAGETSKERYPFFKEKLSAVFSSVQ